MKKVIREKDHQFIITEDNWKTFEVVRRNTPEAIEETNSDIITKVKLRHQLKDAKASIIIQELEKIRSFLNEPEGNGFGLSFEVFCIATLYDLDYQEVIAKYIVHGSDDGKIDAVYWNEQTVSLYQIKMDYIDTFYEQRIRANYIDFLDNQIIDYPNSQDLQNYLTEHYDNIKNKDFQVLTISTNGIGSKNITPQEIYDTFFQNKMLPHKNNIVLTLTVPKDEDSDRHKIILLSKARDEVFAFFSNAKDFIDSLIQVDGIWSGDSIFKYFDDNVRGYVGENEDMVRTIKETPENFAKYNNGITITGSVKYENERGRIVIEHPIISNGQQTIWNLYNNRDQISKIDLLIIVKNDNTPSILDKIARYTNTQKNISPIDLLSLDKSIREIQKYIFLHEKDSLKYFLDINSSGKKEYSTIIKKMYGKYGIISLKEFCRLYYGSDSGKLGNWKNNVSTQIEELLKKPLDPLDKKRALKVCEIIRRYNEFLETVISKEAKNDFKAADLAFKYLLFKYNLTTEKAADIIKEINNEEYYNKPKEERKSKLIDIYKSNDILKKLKEKAGAPNR